MFIKALKLKIHHHHLHIKIGSNNKKIVLTALWKVLRQKQMVWLTGRTVHDVSL